MRVYYLGTSSDSLRLNRVRCQSLVFWLQVRKLSVKRIVTPIIFDNLKNAVPGGLYDPHLGPLDAFTS